MSDIYQYLPYQKLKKIFNINLFKITVIRYVSKEQVFMKNIF